jgi:trigger factor
MAESDNQQEEIFTEPGDIKVDSLTDQGLYKEYQVTITPEVLSGKFDKEINEIASQAKMPGFRPGKVPASLIRTKYQDRLFEDIKQKAFKSGMDKVLKDNNLDPVSSPQTESQKSSLDEGIEFKVKLETRPQIDLPDLSNIELEKPVPKIEDKDLEDAKSKLLEAGKEFSSVKSKTAKAKKGDQVTIDFVGTVNGEEFEGGSSNDYKLELGSGNFVPGFEDQLIGVKIDQQLDVEVTFPEDYNAKDLAGKKANFAVTVKDIARPKQAEFNDEFAKKVGLENAEKLEEALKDQLTNSHEENVQFYLKKQLFDKLNEKLDFELPQQLFDNEKQHILSKFESDQNEANKDSEEDKSNNKESNEEQADKFARRRVKIGLMLAEYAKKNNIQVNQSDLQKAISDQAKQYPGQEQTIIQFYQNNPQALQSLSGPVMEEKAVKQIFDSEVKFIEKEMALSEIDKLIESLEDEQAI